MYIVENFLRCEDYQKIEEFIYSTDFEWKYNATKSLTRGGGHPSDHGYHNQQMFRTIYNNVTGVRDMKYLPHFMPVGALLAPFAALRMKINFQFPCAEVIQSPFHHDIAEHKIPNDVKVYTAILYLNTNNGYTIFEDTGEKIESKRNRLVVFDARRAHAGTSFTDARNRIVININFIPSIETEMFLERNNVYCKEGNQ